MIEPPTDTTRIPLSQGYLLDDYRIEKPIGGGGFSLVYMAYNTRTQAKVVIKEYFPEMCVFRIAGGKLVPYSEDTIQTFQLGAKRFVSEAAALAKLKHPNIIHVSSFFRTNNTVYMVMEYIQGRDLRWFIKRSRGRMSERFLLTSFLPILEGLNELHRCKFVHLDIKPANVLLRKEGRPLLIDFGAVQYLPDTPTASGVQTLTHGFAPLEQYCEGKLGPWSDLYALGSSMYTCVAGQVPPPAPDREKRDKLVPLGRRYHRKYSKPLLDAIDWSLQLNLRHRPQDVDSLLKLLHECPPSRDKESSAFSWLPFRRNNDF